MPEHDIVEFFDPNGEYCEFCWINLRERPDGCQPLYGECGRNCRNSEPEQGIAP